MAYHLRPLRLASGQRPRRAIERQVAQPDGYKGVQNVLKFGKQRCDGRLVQIAHPCGQVANLHGACVGDTEAADLRRTGELVEASFVAIRTLDKRDGPLDELPDVRLKRLLVLGRKRLLHTRDEPFVGDVQAFDLDLSRLAVEQVPQLLLGVVADGLVRIQKARGDIGAHQPPVGRVVGNLERPLVQ